MKDSELIQKLEKELLFRQKSVEALKKAIAALKLGLIDESFYAQEGDEYIKNVSSQLTNYPLNGKLLDKIRYLEDHELRFWRAKDMIELITQVEGKEMAETTLRNIAAKMWYYVKKKWLICLKISNSNKYTFYCTVSHKETWITLSQDGNHKIQPGHEPNPQLLAKLSDEQRNNTKWYGL